MKRYVHVPTDRISWAMRISDGIFLPDAARPESEGLIYDAETRLVSIIDLSDGGVQSAGGVGDWVVEVVPGEFQVVTDDAFGRTYQASRRAP